MGPMRGSPVVLLIKAQVVHLLKAQTLFFPLLGSIGVLLAEAHVVPLAKEHCFPKTKSTQNLGKTKQKSNREKKNI